MSRRIRNRLFIVTRKSGLHLVTRKSGLHRRPQQVRSGRCELSLLECGQTSRGPRPPDEIQFGSPSALVGWALVNFEDRCGSRTDRYSAPLGDRRKDRERWRHDGHRGIDGAEWRGVVLLIADPNESRAVGLHRVQLPKAARIVLLGEAESPSQ